MAIAPRIKLACAIVAALTAAPAASAPPATHAKVLPAGELRVWKQVPADTSWSGPETTGKSATPAGSPIAIRSNVTDPTLTVFVPPRGKASGTSVIIVPGGAFMALAWDLEGLEVAHWFASRGVTAFVLKYRVGPPPRNKSDPMPTDVAGLVRMLEPNRKLAIADAGQAVRLVRENAARYHLAANRVGMIGFSAGAMTALGLVQEGDAAARPDFIMPVYGMMKAGSTVPADAPPAFIVAAADDRTIPASASAEVFNKWTSAGRPAELHIFEKGEHGFGMRAQGQPIDHWTGALEAWLAAKGFLPAARETTRQK